MFVYLPGSVKTTGEVERLAKEEAKEMGMAPDVDQIKAVYMDLFTTHDLPLDFKRT